MPTKHVRPANHDHRARSCTVVDTAAGVSFLESNSNGGARLIVDA